MTDLPTQNDPKNIPLNSSPQNVDYQNPSSIETNQSNNHSEANIIYKTPFNALICFLVLMFFIMWIGMEILFTFFLIGSSDGLNGIYILFIPLILLIISIIIGSCCNLYYSFTIDKNSGVIYIDIKKMCCCFNKKKVVLIKNIIKFIVQTDVKASYKYNGVLHKFFEIIFVLNDGRIVKGCSGVVDINEEGKKAFNILRDNLPQSISYVQDLTAL